MRVKGMLHRNGAIGFTLPAREKAIPRDKHRHQLLSWATPLNVNHLLRYEVRRRCPRVCAKGLLTRPQIPMVLTYARVAAIPLLFVTHAPPPLPAHPTLSALLFAMASVTDFLDGYLARLWHAETALGAFLDPVADKLLVAVALSLIVARGFAMPVPFRVAVPIASALILAREVFVSALREWMALRGKSAVVKVNIWGKVKTATQMVAITVLLYASKCVTHVAALGVFALVVSAILSITSAGEYAFSAWLAFRQSEE